MSTQAVTDDVLTNTRPERPRVSAGDEGQEEEVAPASEETLCRKRRHPETLKRNSSETKSEYTNCFSKFQSDLLRFCSSVQFPGSDTSLPVPFNTEHQINEAVVVQTDFRERVFLCLEWSGPSPQFDFILCF